jgi:hypothetical protein
MIFSRRPLWLLAAMCLAILGPGVQSLFAQDSLPTAILQAQDELTTEEQATIDQFLKAQVIRLQSSDPQQVALGRARLTEQFGLGNSQFFTSSYRQAIAKQLIPLLAPDSPLMTRLNVAIVSAKLSGQSLVDVLQTGEDDPSPAVRYWIAKAVGTAAKNKRLEKQQQKDVLVVMANRLKAEDSSLVLEQVMLAIAEIDLPEAIQQVLDGLDARVTFHKQNPVARFKPVHGGMQQLWSKLIALRAAGKSVDNQQKDLARIALRYYALIADQLALNNDNNDEQEAQEIRQDKVAMAGICSRVMDDVAQQVARITPPQAIDPNNAAELKVSADRWHEVLKAPPFNFTDEELAVGE